MGNRILRAAAAVPLSMLLFGAAAAATTATDASSDADCCEDTLYKIYNECLMSTDSIWVQRLCDYEFAFNMARCRKKAS